MAPSRAPEHFSSGVESRDPPGPADRPPEDPPRHDAGGGRGWAWLMTASGTVEAALVRGYLESAGIPVALDGRDPSPQAWMFPGGNVSAPVRILVPRALLDAARLELMEAGLSPGSGEPGEGSEEEAERTLARRRARMPVSVALLAVLAVVTLVLIVARVGSMTCVLRIFCS